MYKTFENMTIENMSYLHMKKRVKMKVNLIFFFLVRINDANDLAVVGEDVQ